MIYFKTNIVDAYLRPIKGAQIYVSDNEGTPIKRNGVVIMRESDNEGSVIIPALETDLLTISKSKYERTILQATDKIDEIILDEKASFFNSFTGHVYITEGIVILAIVTISILVIRSIFSHSKK